MKTLKIWDLNVADTIKDNRTNTKIFVNRNYILCTGGEPAWQEHKKHMNFYKDYLPHIGTFVRVRMLLIEKINN